MSETGRLSGFYQQAHKYADLVDRVLINLKTGLGSLDDPARKELSSLLMHIADETSEDLPSRLLLIGLQSRSNFRELNLANIGKTLLSQEVVAPEIIGKLEDLARALEEEEVDAMVRMRRWIR